MHRGFGWTERLFAACVHLSISLLVAIFAAALVFGVWYPYPFREISGGISLFGILVGVDVVVGPLLTGLVFNLRKPRTELRRDIAVVSFLQLGALTFGLWSMYQARPVYLVHEVDRFVTVSAADVDPEDLKEALPEFRSLPQIGLQVLGLRDVEDPDEKLKSLELSLAGRDLSLQPRFWQKLSASNKSVIRNQSKPLRELASRSEGAYLIVVNWLDDRAGKIDDFRFFPLVSRQHFWTVVLDKDLKMVGYLPIDPF
jgi:hypothetical protein